MVQEVITAIINMMKILKLENDMLLQGWSIIISDFGKTQRSVKALLFAL